METTQRFLHSTPKLYVVDSQSRLHQKLHVELITQPGLLDKNPELLTICLDQYKAHYSL
ncbi:13769_t:CDS:2 [Ambispora leptoticha]|uniref:13769_t:CDS:1 n=1 Tax=Ambispora leptoticha TaxID=144679 RepID=A0A9N9ABT0_9GLOM|nr:13769_t:CDS:2 [Ambispora leptoticha]